MIPVLIIILFVLAILPYALIKTDKTIQKSLTPIPLYFVSGQPVETSTIIGSGPLIPLAPQGFESTVSYPIGFDGVATSIYAKTRSVPGPNAGASYSYTLYINGNPTAVTTSINNFEGASSDTGFSVPVKASDWVSINVNYSDSAFESPVHWVTVMVTPT